STGFGAAGIDVGEASLPEAAGAAAGVSAGGGSRAGGGGRISPPVDGVVGGVGGGITPLFGTSGPCASAGPGPLGVPAGPKTEGGSEVGFPPAAGDPAGDAARARGDWHPTRPAPAVESSAAAARRGRVRGDRLVGMGRAGWPRDVTGPSPTWRDSAAGRCRTPGGRRPRRRGAG